MQNGSQAGAEQRNEERDSARPQLEPWEQVEQRLCLGGMTEYRCVLRTVYGICEELGQRLDALQGGGAAPLS